MARLGRYFLPEQPLHVIQRGNNRQAIFFDDDDYVHAIGSPKRRMNMAASFTPTC
jgi:REP element-mobilizing transposase RayT